MLQKLNTYNKGKGIEWFYFCRSYKVMQLFIDEANFKVIQKFNEEIYPMIFHQIYKYFSSDETYGSLYHIGSLLNFLFRQNPKQSLFLMVEYNLFWSLIYEINNPEIFNIVSGLLDPIVNTYEFDEEVLNNFINYLIHQNMMEDVINQLFDVSENRYKSEYQWKSEQAIELSKILQEAMKCNQNQKSVDFNDKRNLDRIIGEFEPCKKYYEVDQKIMPMIRRTQTFKKGFVHTINQCQYPENINYSQLTNCDIDNLQKLKSGNQQHNTQISVILEKQDSITNIKRMKTEDVQKINRLKLLISTGSPRSFIQPLTPQMQQSPSKQSPSIQSPSKMNYKIFVSRTQRKQVNHFSKSLNQCDSDKFSFSKHTMSKLLQVQDYGNSQLITKGFASAQLVTIYPSNTFLVCNNTLEEESNRKEYDLKSIQKYDYNAIACAKLFLQLITSVFDYTKNPKYYNQITQKEVNNSIIQLLLKMVLKKECLQIIAKNFIFKIVSLTKFNYLFNSALICGQIMSTLLENMYKFNYFIHYRNTTVLKVYESMIVSVIDEVFELMQKLVIKLNFSDLGTLKIQDVNLNIVGTSKITLIKCLWICMKNSLKFKNINETVQHIITLWFFEYHQNTQYNVQFLQFLNVLLEKGSYLCIVNLLIKINFLSSLANAHQQICFNLNIQQSQKGVYTKFHKINGQNIENMFLCIKKIVKIIQCGLDTGSLSILRPQLEKLQSWTYLQSLDDSYQKQRLSKQLSPQSRVSLKQAPQLQQHQKHRIQSLSRDDIQQAPFHKMKFESLDTQASSQKSIKNTLTNSMTTSHRSSLSNRNLKKLLPIIQQADFVENRKK